MQRENDGLHERGDAAPRGRIAPRLEEVRGGHVPRGLHAGLFRQHGGVDERGLAERVGELEGAGRRVERVVLEGDHGGDFAAERLDELVELLALRLPGDGAFGRADADRRADVAEERVERVTERVHGGGLTLTDEDDAVALVGREVPSAAKGLNLSKILQLMLQYF